MTAALLIAAGGQVGAANGPSGKAAGPVGTTGAAVGSPDGPVRTAGGQGAEDGEWRMFGRVLALVQSVAHTAARSSDPRAVEKSVEGLLSGENPHAARLADALLDEALEDMPAQYKSRVVALAADLATIARKERARQPAATAATAADTAAALQARKDLAAIGLRYFDAGHFLDAVKREDALAVELFVRGRGVDLAAKDAAGQSVLDIAQKRNNHRLAELLGAHARR